MKLKAWALAALICCQSYVAQANVPLMPVGDITPGMQGIGKTVVQGDTIEEFPVEVIGVNGSAGSGYSILVKLSGPLIDKVGGVAQGMSGSPVYIDGRLVGAVAYGKLFNDPHYCFLTPIGEMLKLIDMPAAKPLDWIPKSAGLQAAGFSEAGLARLNERFAELGLGEVNSAGGVGETGNKDLEPGSAVGAALMTGDMTLGALGTVTWVDDEGQVLAFGHPFMQRGDSSFLMNRVWVLGCIPNMQASYKVGNIGEVIGTFNQDRSSGIGGKLGSTPRTIPLFVTASDKARGINRSARVKAIDDEKLLPAIVDAATVSVASKAMNRGGGGTAKLKYHILGEDSQHNRIAITRKNMYYSTSNLLKNLNQELNDTTSVLMSNKLDKVKLHGIDIEAEINDEVQVAEIKEVRGPKKPVKPGEKFSMLVKLKPYRGEAFERKVDFTVPKDFKNSRLSLNVHGGSSVAWIVNLLRKQKNDEDGAAPPQKKEEKQQTLQDYAKSVNDADCNNEIIIDISDGKLNNAQKDEGLAGMLKGSKYKTKYSYDFIVDGDVDITLKVDK